MDFIKKEDIINAVLPVRIDATNAKLIESSFVEAISVDTKKLLVDFSQNDYISSAGLRVLLFILKKMQNQQGKMALYALKPYIKEILDIAGFCQLFTICETHDEALTKI